MKLRPTILFISVTVLLLLYGILTNNKTLDIQLHDTYFIIDYLHISIIFSVITGLTAMIYYGLEGFKRPIKTKTGFWHFGLFTTGIILLFITINLLTQTNYHDTNIYCLTALIFIGIILLLMSGIVFIYGFTKAIYKK